jgi:hypothetical protein
VVQKPIFFSRIAVSLDESSRSRALGQMIFELSRSVGGREREPFCRLEKRLDEKRLDEKRLEKGKVAASLGLRPGT